MSSSCGSVQRAFGGHHQQSDGLQSLSGIREKCDRGRRVVLVADRGIMSSASKEPGMSQAGTEDPAVALEPKYLSRAEQSSEQA